MKCPHCLSEKVYRSERGSAAIPWLLRPFVVSLRCHVCREQFYGRGYLLGGRVPANPPLDRGKSGAKQS